jgi:hypothetical protein
MRWVDIDKIELPDKWEKRADKALNELRKEIEDAEQAAQLAGEDIAAARKKAITEGLKKKSPASLARSRQALIRSPKWKVLVFREQKPNF